ncbi:MAG: hypothetical protein ACJAVZ_003575, partial [Afipia broomeae]
PDSDTTLKINARCAPLVFIHTDRKFIT